MQAAVIPSNKGNAITWPFHEKNWLASLWMPLIWWTFPPFGGLISLGWSVEVVRRRTRRDLEPLPQASDLGAVLKDGFVVWLMAMLYFAVPLLIIGKLVEFSWLGQIWQLAAWVWDVVFHNPHEDLRSFLLRQTFQFLAHAEAPVIYLAVAVPMFLAAKVRYALTGKARSFFKLFANAALCIHHIGGVLLYLFLSVTTLAVLGLLQLVFVTSGIGIPAALLLGSASVWILAYWAGDLAAQVQDGDRTGNR